MVLLLTMAHMRPNEKHPNLCHTSNQIYNGAELEPTYPRPFIIMERINF